MNFQIPIIQGDLITVDVDLIVQQCNCLTITSKGLSEYIKNKLRVDPYSQRDVFQIEEIVLSKKIVPK